MPYCLSWRMTNDSNKPTPSLDVISGCAVTRTTAPAKSLALSTAKVLQGVHWGLSVSPDHIWERLKPVLEGFCKRGKELSWLLLFMTNTAAELEDLSSPCGFGCGLQNLRFHLKRIKFPVCFPGVTVRTCADRLLSSEAITRHTKTMPQPEQEWPFPIHLNGVLNLKPN